MIGFYSCSGFTNRTAVDGDVDGWNDPAESYSCKMRTVEVLTLIVNAQQEGSEKGIGNIDDLMSYWKCIDSPITGKQEDASEEMYLKGSSFVTARAAIVMSL